MGSAPGGTTPTSFKLDPHSGHTSLGNPVIAYPHRPHVGCDRYGRRHSRRAISIKTPAALISSRIGERMPRVGFTSPLRPQAHDRHRVERVVAHELPQRVGRDFHERVHVLLEAAVLL